MKNQIKLVAGALILAIFASSPCFAQERREIPEAHTFGAPASAADATALNAALNAYKNAWGEEDTPALMALHAEDGEWINAYARIFRDKAALADFLEHKLFPAFPAGTSKREANAMTVISTRYIGDDGAVIHLYTDADRGPSVNEAYDLRRTHIHLVWEKRADGWKIVHTVIMDAR